MIKSTTIALTALILSYAPFYNDSTTCFRDCVVTPMGRGFIERNEGEVDYVYKDVAGNKTVCYGHLVKAGEHFGLMTPDMCGNLLKRDLEPVQAHINWQVNRPIKLNQVDALADLLFNTGLGDKLNLFKRVNEAKDPEFTLFSYAKIDGKETILRGLLRRRQAEAALYRL